MLHNQNRRSSIVLAMDVHAPALVLGSKTTQPFCFWSLHNSEPLARWHEHAAIIAKAQSYKQIVDTWNNRFMSRRTKKLTAMEHLQQASSHHLCLHKLEHIQIHCTLPFLNILLHHNQCNFIFQNIHTYKLNKC